MLYEISVAVNYFSSHLYNKLPRRRVDCFSEELSKYLHKKFQHHWHATDPSRDSAYRVLNIVGPSTDIILPEAAAISGLDWAEIQACLPDCLIINIDPGHVSCQYTSSNSSSSNSSMTMDKYSPSVWPLSAGAMWIPSNSSGNSSAASSASSSTNVTTPNQLVHQILYSPQDNWPNSSSTWNDNTLLGATTNNNEVVSRGRSSDNLATEAALSVLFGSGDDNDQHKIYNKPWKSPRPVSTAVSHGDIQVKQFTANRANEITSLDFDPPISNNSTSGHEHNNNKMLGGFHNQAPNNNNNNPVVFTNDPAAYWSNSVRFSKGQQPTTLHSPPDDLQQYQGHFRPTWPPPPPSLASVHQQSRSTSTPSFTASAFAQTKFGSTKLKNQSSTKRNASSSAGFAGMSTGFQVGVNRMLFDGSLNKTSPISGSGLVNHHFIDRDASACSNMLSPDMFNNSTALGLDYSAFQRFAPPSSTSTSNQLPIGTPQHHHSVSLGGGGPMAPIGQPPPSSIAPHRTDLASIGFQSPPHNHSNTADVVGGTGGLISSGLLLAGPSSNNGHYHNSLSSNGSHNQHQHLMTHVNGTEGEPVCNASSSEIESINGPHLPMESQRFNRNQYLGGLMDDFVTTRPNQVTMSSDAYSQLGHSLGCWSNQSGTASTLVSTGRSNQHWSNSDTNYARSASWIPDNNHRHELHQHNDSLLSSRMISMLLSDEPDDVDGCIAASGGNNAERNPMYTDGCQQKSQTEPKSETMEEEQSNKFIHHAQTIIDNTDDSPAAENKDN